jgi:hypothetical protein
MGYLFLSVTGNATLTLNNIVGTGEPQWISFYYHNPDGLCESCVFVINIDTDQLMAGTQSETIAVSLASRL